MEVVVKNIKCTNLVLQFDDPKLQALVPKTLVPAKFQFELLNVSNAVSNGIRRTLCCELAVIGFDTEYSQIITDDRKIMPEVIIKRLHLIPILQTTPHTARFELDVYNDTNMIRVVKSSELKIMQPTKEFSKNNIINDFDNRIVPAKQLLQLPCNETHTICDLAPHTSLKIKEITVRQRFGYEVDCGGNVAAINVASEALDQKPINMYDPNAGGISSSVSNPQHWLLSFTTNGTVDTRMVVIAACKNLIYRLQTINKLQYLITTSENMHSFIIQGESDTIGNLLVRTICNSFKNIDITYSVASVGRVLTITSRYKGDMNDVYKTVITKLTNIFNNIIKQIT